MTLFNQDHFVLHSGKVSGWKVDCDALDRRDIVTCAWLISQRYSFGRVLGIPKGGSLLASCLKEYVDPTVNRLLIVDDVITTGDSFREAGQWVRQQGGGPYAGIAIFGRGDPDTYPSWVNVIFQASPWFTGL